MTTANQNLIARRRKALGPTYTHFYDEPLHIVRGEGIWLYDSEGKKYLDCYNNVPSVGHCNPHVVEAITRQISTLNTHTRYLHENVIEYAEMLTATIPEDDYVVLLVCTGTEANDLAYRIASTVTGNKGVIITENVYHGNSTLVSELSPSEGRHHPCPDFIVEVAAPDSYRGKVEAQGINAAIEQLAENGHQPAMQLIEGAFENPGLFTPDKSYYQEMIVATRAAGGLIVFDEVQSGLCRQGENFWAFQNSDLVPDIITMGKPLGCGHPLAAVVVKRDVIEAFGKVTDYFNTFGGNPVSAAAGRAVLQYIHQENILQNVHDTGIHFRAGLAVLQQKHNVIGDIRGKGMFIGIDLVKDRNTKEHAPKQAARLIELTRDEGMLISTVGVEENVLKIRPPLIFNIENTDMALGMLSNAFDAL
jgi:4-aminobutyrate aminotransferase-like enzyme